MAFNMDDYDPHLFDNYVPSERARRRWREIVENINAKDNLKHPREYENSRWDEYTEEDHYETVYVSELMHFESVFRRAAGLCPKGHTFRMLTGRPVPDIEGVSRVSSMTFREYREKLEENPRYYELRKKALGSKLLMSSGNYNDAETYLGYVFIPKSEYSFNSTGEIDEYFWLISEPDD